MSNTINKLFLGCDPDLHTCAFAIVREDFSIHQVWVVRSEDTKEQDAVLGMIKNIIEHDPGYSAGFLEAYAVESQEIYLTGKGRTKNPRNILHLGHISGAVLNEFGSYFPDAAAYFPVPSAWKGQVDKLTHHRRILTKAGYADDEIVVCGGKDCYCTIVAPKAALLPGWEHMHHGDWKHVTDAIGLAQYAAERYLTEIRKQELLSKVRGKT